MKTKISPERKELHHQQESKWYNGDRGAGTSWPYRIKRYLSKEFSDRIRAEVDAKCAEWVAKLEAIKPSKRVVGRSNWCEELRPQWCCIDSCDVNALSTKVCGHTIYVKILDSYWKKNGQYGIKPMEQPILSISRYYNSPNDGDWHHVGEQLNFEICWDEEKGLYYVCMYCRASTPPIKITRKNWARGRCRTKFMAEVFSLEGRLEKDGVKIGKLVKLNGYKHGLENYYVDCVADEITA